LDWYKKGTRHLAGSLFERLGAPSLGREVKPFTSRLGAALSWHLIEAPAMKLKRLFASPPQPGRATPKVEG